jgi:hypothetical protein
METPEFITAKEAAEIAKNNSSTIIPELEDSLYADDILYSVIRKSSEKGFCSYELRNLKLSKSKIEELEQKGYKVYPITIESPISCGHPILIGHKISWDETTQSNP